MLGQWIATTLTECTKTIVDRYDDDSARREHMAWPLICATRLKVAAVEEGDNRQIAIRAS